jgi:SAM-dependent methyltransferase
MAHPEQLEFVGMVKTAFPTFFKGARTLEIGSLDINGTIRQFFVDCPYIGLDVAAGPGVDVVCQGQSYDAQDGSFDTVISCEAMEHNPYWQQTLANMIRVCRPGGLIIMTCATVGRKEHGTTRTSPSNSPLSVGLGWEYYKNLTARDIKGALTLDNDLSPHAFFTNWTSRDLYLIGFKRGAPPPVDAGRHIAAFRSHYHRNNLRYALKSNYLQIRVLISVFGEERYWAGPIRLR